ncbi:MAG: chromosomal replication initiator protein DnaA [Peptoniphilus sp.]|nr:chromosomal replication initiator protein DnaA [Peptoniphilus sp.]MDD7363537.1 chromosomal replication initiator protein DnaA [Bacillota bacterium]MDY6044760.1 chromosomal replication initiator protein DnaA [Peptoniphilus sp.]
MAIDVKTLWKNAFQLILEENLYESQINTWFRPITPIRIQGDTLILGVSREFVLNHLKKNNNNYKNLIRRVVREVSGRDLDIEFILTGDRPVDPVLADTTAETVYHLNPKYTFDSFVVGPSNQFAHAASLAVAENPKEAHANPLFIYGGVGLGKTHLMHAIGHFMHRNDPSKRILYVTSEQFTNEFIASIQTNRNEEFRRKYRSQDLLLIDDIQFIADKESTMDEFFHTFNELHDQNKQIVLTSDKPPKDIQKLEQRLISRFAWGLVVDIQAPDLETRIAILRNKASSDGFDVPNEVINYIATHVKSNIRELEGALSRVTAYSKLTTGVITEETAAYVLKDIYESNQPTQITVSHIQSIVADSYQITVEQMNSKKRSRPLAYPRQIAMYLTREMTDLSLPKIGQEFGGRDHSTVIHACDKIKGDMEKDTEFAIEIESLKEKIKGN